MEKLETSLAPCEFAKNAEVLFIGMTHSVLLGWIFKRPFAWLALAELSTVFLNGRWLAQPP